MTRNVAGRSLALPLLLCLAGAAAGCNATVDATNPYDPESLDQAPSSVSGKVRAAGLDAATPIPVLLRSLRDPARADERVTDAGSGEERSFRFDVVLPGSYALEISVLGYDPVTRLVDVRIGEDVEVGLLDLVPQDGDRGGALHGVVGLEGRAAGDSADVVVTLDDGAESRVTDGSGSFRMEGVRPGTHRLQFRHPDFLSPDAPLELEVAAGGDTDVNLDADGNARPILLHPNPGSIQGAVVAEDPSGVFVPVAGIDVTVEGGADAVVTDGTGSFSLPGVIPGEHLVVASFAGHLPARVAVTVRGGQAVALAEPLTLRYRKGAFHGSARLTDRNAGEFDLLTVELRGPDGLALAALPRASVELRSGGFGFTGLPVGTYHVVARHDAYGIAEADVLVLEGEDVELPELELARLEGDFAIDGGAPYTNSPDGAVLLQFELPANAARLRVSQDEALFETDQGWEAIPAGGLRDFTLHLLDGEQTVFAQLEDTDGAVGRLLRSTIVRDTQGPTPSAAPAAIVIGAGTGYASESDGTLTVSLSAVDPPRADGALGASGVGRVEVWIDEAALPDQGNLASAPYVTSPLVIQRVAPDPLADGARLVHAVFYDRAGNPSEAVVAQVILDRVLPAGSIRIVASDPADSYVRSTRVEVQVTASDANEPLEIRLSNSQSFGQLAFGPADPVIEHSLGFGDGPKTIYAELRDAAGNVTGNLFDQIQLDTVGPVAQGLLLAGGAVAVADPTVAVTALGSGAATLELSVISPSGAVQAPGGPFPTTSVTLAAEEGEHRVTAVLVDEAGNRSTSVTDTVQLDTIAPGAASVAISEGADVRNATVTLLLFAQGATGMRVATDGAVDTEPAQPYATSLAVALAGVDGVKTVEVVFVDDAGNAAAPVQASTTLDRSAPVAGGSPIVALLPAPFTSSSETAVNLQLSATGATEMRVAPAATPTSAPWVPYSASTVVFLPATDGACTVSVEFRDLAGNSTGPFTTSVTLDTVPPTSPQVTLSGQAPYATSRSLTPSLLATGASFMKVGFEASLSGATLEAYAAGAYAGLPALAADGAATVYAQFFDAAGNATGILSAATTVDTLAPENPQLRLVSVSPVSSLSVQVEPFALGAAEMSFVIDGTAGAYQAYSSAATVALPATQGAHTIAVQFRDAAGNVTAVASRPSVSVTLDTVGPVAGATPLAVVYESPFTSVRTSTVNLSFSATGADEMRFAASSTPSGEAWVSYATGGVLLLPAPDGAKTVSVEFRDLAGNVAGPYTTPVTLDTAAPTGPAITLPTQSPYSTSRTLSPTLAATGASFMKVSHDPGFAGASMLAYTAGIHNGLPALAADGAATVYAQYWDAAGNATPVVAASTTVDSLAPESEGLVLVTRSPVSADSVTVAPFAVGASQLRFFVDGVAGALQPYATSLSVSLPLVDGAHTIAVEFQDAAGNATPAASRPSVPVTRDTLAPQSPSVTVRGFIGYGCNAPNAAACSGAGNPDTLDYTRLDVLAVTLGVTGATSFSFGAGVLDCDTATYLTEPAFPVTRVLGNLGLAEGSNTVTACFRDAAGNVSFDTGTISLDTTPASAPRVQSLTPAQGLVSWSWQPSTSTETGLTYRALEAGTSGGVAFFQDTGVTPSGSRSVVADNCTDVTVAIGVLDPAGNFSVSAPSTTAPRFNAPSVVDVVGWHRSVAVTWAAVPGADHYEVDLVDTTGNSAVITARASAAGATSLRLVTPDFSTALVDGHSYQARVVATDATGACDGADTSSGTDATLLPTSTQERFGGWQLAGGADFDLDGHEDWATLAGTGSRQANVISGRTGEVLLSVGPQGRSQGTGSQQSFIDDLDSDGDPDFLVADPVIGGTPPEPAPRVAAYSGRDGTPIWAAAGVVGEQLGSAIAPISDVTGDGVPDVIAGAPNAAGGGRVVVIDGATGAIVGTPATGAGLAGAAPRFGAALSTATFPAASCGIATSCQVVLVGAPGATSSGGLTGAGAAVVLRVVSGAAPSFVSLAPTRLWYGAEADAELGTAVSFFLDGDQDATHDVALGAPGAGGRAGRVELRSGASGASIAVYTDPDTAGSARLGSSLAASIDLDGDGGGELLAGAPGQNGTCPIGPTTTAAGRAILISGSRGDALWTRDGDPCDFGTQASALGTSVAFSDTDADGAPDYILGAPGADRAFIRDNGVTYVFDGHDLGLFPAGLRAFKLFEYSLDAVDGTPPYTFSPVLMPSGGSITADGSYRSGNTVAVSDRVRVTDAKGRTRTIAIPVYDFGQTTTISPPGNTGRMNVAVVGDMTGPGGLPDGVPEVAVSAMGQPCGIQPNCGHVYVYNGATGVLHLDLAPGFANAGFGAAILGLPDLTGDGKAELVVSGIYPTGGSDGSWDSGGQLRLFDGATGVQLGSRINGTSAQELGYVLVGVPSGTSPGRFLASAPGHAAGAGAIYVCDADGLGMSCVLGYAPAGDGAELGRSLAVGDVSGDDVPEVIAGAPSSGNLGGRVEVLALDPSTGLLSLRLSTTATGGGDSFGSAVAVGSDYDLDGRPDLIVGASQRMAFFGPGDVIVVSSSSGIELGSAGNVPAGGKLLRTSDADWDGRIDIYGLSGTRELFLISGQTLQTYGRISATESSIDIGDLDLDGVADVVGAEDSGQLHIFRSRIP